MKKYFGFTIVELMVVVAVIGILAAISAVAYTGIIDRGNNAKTLVLVKQYEDIMRLYKLDTGTYPNVSAEYACLPAALPATTTFAANVCEVANGANVATTTPDGKDFKAMLSTVKAVLPDVTYADTFINYQSGTGWKARGMVYTDDGASSIRFHLAGTGDCPLGVREGGAGSGSSSVCTLYLK